MIIPSEAAASASAEGPILRTLTFALWLPQCVPFSSSYSVAKGKDARASQQDAGDRPLSAGSGFWPHEGQLLDNGLETSVAALLKLLANFLPFYPWSQRVYILNLGSTLASNATLEGRHSLLLPC